MLYRLGRLMFRPAKREPVTADSPLSKASQHLGRAAEIAAELASIVGSDRDASAGKPDGGVAVPDEPGKPTSIDHDMPACSSAGRAGAFRDIFRDDTGRLVLEGRSHRGTVGAHSYLNPWWPW